MNSINFNASNSINYSSVGNSSGFNQKLPEFIQVDSLAKQVIIKKTIYIRVTELVPLIEQAVTSLPSKTYISYGVGQGMMAHTFKDDKGNVHTKVSEGWGAPSFNEYTQYEYIYKPESMLQEKKNSLKEK